MIRLWKSTPMSLAVLCLMLGTCLSGFSYASKTDYVTDSFDDGVIDLSLWETYEPGLLHFEETGGEMKVYSTSTGSGTYCQLRSKFILSGDFDVQYDYRWVSGLGTDRTRTQLWVKEQETSNYFQLNFWRYGVPSGSVMWTSSIHGTINESYNPPLTGKLRIKRVGTSFTGYFYNGGWVSLGTRTGFSGDVQVVLDASFNGGSPLDVRWDNFQVGSDVVPVETLSWGEIKSLFR